MYRKFVKVIPFPDELAHSIIARVALANCCHSELVISSLRTLLQLPPTDNPVFVLAAGLSMDRDILLTRHTMHPLHYAVARNSALVPLSSRKNGFQALFGPKSAATARYCELCFLAERGTCVIPSWRRKHHLPAVDWCPVHFTPLRAWSTELAAPFFRHSQQGLFEHLDAEVASSVENAVLRRYGQLLTSWLDRSVPYSSLKVCKVILAECHRQNIRCSKEGSAPLLSDILLSKLPPTWVHRHMPHLANKKAGIAHPKFDTLGTSSSDSFPTASLALILAALFASISDIDRALESY
ncbi:hypothetical protein F2P44_26000 [Massilia sp. CCM 8695]|uniref:TniQ domain-containing protein n=1 Tax=Massilia frigida TaxID=2609281 RepID=A0ABX0NJZ4_9BURK|nr:hypothetical protein [Massilia frigida]